MMSTLTEAQKQRIEENRKKALEKRAAAKRNQCNLFQSKFTLSNDSTSASSSSNDLPVKSYTSRSFNSVSATSNSSHETQSSLKVSFSTTTSVTSTKQFHSTTSVQKPSIPSTLTLSDTCSHIENKSKSSAKVPYDKKNDNQRKATFAFLSSDRFFVEIGYDQKIIDVFKTIPSRKYDANTKRWNFSIKDHDSLATKLRSLQPEVIFASLPKNLVELFSKNSTKKETSEYDLSILDPVLLNALLPFQKEGVNFSIRNNGKVLIADDMGLGKTIQGIAVANYYKKDWPLLVVMPSSVKYSWADAFHKWLPSESHEVTIINSGKEYITKDKIILLSYDILTKKKDDILKRGFKSMIIDESHCLKNFKSARTKAAQQIMQSMTRIIMLSGTPALSRPIELFPQISALNRKIFPNFIDYGIRYCNGKKMQWGWDFSGSSNMEELQLLLEGTVMIRRLKSDVIKQLPSKRRQIIILDPSQVTSKSKTLKDFSKQMARVNLKGMERRGVLLQYFHQTGLVKIPAICEYIKDLLEADKKFLVFGHHQAVLDRVCDTAEEAKIEYIRIDGTTSSEQRKLLCDKFQLSEKCRIAVLSITSANAGLTLTAAHLVVFAELFWNPGILTQAEDRVHRIGQEDSVIVQYLIAKGTADDEIWPLVQRKLDTLNKAGLSKDNFSDSSTVKREGSNQPHLEDFWNELENDADFQTLMDNSDFSTTKRLKFS